jgi:hypothetical protein
VAPHLGGETPINLRRKKVQAAAERFVKGAA